jgi:hypothetical protein
MTSTPPCLFLPRWTVHLLVVCLITAIHAINIHESDGLVTKTKLQASTSYGSIESSALHASDAVSQARRSPLQTIAIVIGSMLVASGVGFQCFLDRWVVRNTLRFNRQGQDQDRQLEATLFDFLVVGDWGGADVSNGIHRMKIANVMEQWAEKSGSEVVLSVGDNFYAGGRFDYDGVISKDDPKFHEIWER